MAEDLYGPNECGEYPLGDTAAPEGADANRMPFESPDPGIHVFEITDFGLTKEKKDFKWKGNACRLYQLRPRLQVVGGNAAITAFLPCPTKGEVMLPEIASQWMQFVTALGFDLPPGSMIPNGFRLPDLLHKRCKASVVLDLDADNNQKLDPKGRARVKIDLFGYMRVDETEKPVSKPTTKKTEPAKAPVSMDDL
jgi:hypothetical protein